MILTRYYVVSLLFTLLIAGSAKAQQAYLQEDLNWKPIRITQLDSTVMIVPQSAQTFWSDEDKIPYFIKRVPIGSDEELRLDPNQFAMYEDADPTVYGDYLNLLNTTYRTFKRDITVSYQTERKKRYAVIRVAGVQLENGKAHLLTHLTLRWATVRAPRFLGKGGPTWKNESMLKDGNWVKLIFAESGIYQLTVSELQGFGLDLNGQDISRIRMYGYAGGMLPEDNALTQYDDLEEMAIEVRDKNSNGVFDGSDDVLFFAYGPHKVWYNASDNSYTKQIHYYSNLAAVFITSGNPGGKRIGQASPVNQPVTYTTSSFDEIIHFEEEKFNLIKSGRDWFGKEFGRTTTSHTETMSLINPASGEQATIQTRALARCAVMSNMQVRINGQQVLVHPMDKSYVYDYAAPFASSPRIERADFTPSGTLNIEFIYNKPTNDARAWLDYVEVIYRRKLSGTGQFILRDKKSMGPGAVGRYNFEGTGFEVWDLSDPLNIRKVPVQSDNGNNYFTDLSDTYKEYAVRNGESFKKVQSTEVVAKQNIHGEKNVDYVIVTAPEFKSEAERLAQHHRDRNGLSTLVVTPVQVYNEFSSGVPDIAAIRNMMRYFYETASPGNEPKYLMLFGDASYDYKNILGINTNFVPTFESRNSVAPVGSFCTDDFYALLDESEGADVTSGALDIAVGRLPLQSIEQATNMVNKFIAYQTTQGLGEWRNTVVFVTDDSDNNVHMHDGMAFSSILETDHQDYNVRKVYADSYKQITVGNGQRYPDVVKEIDRAFNDGALIVNYSGHGGETQLGDEKYVEIPQIQSWSGGYKLPLFITATCEFTRFDDPARVSAGEMVVLNPNGGGIGLLTTTRLVFQWPNRLLNASFYDNNCFNYAPGQEPSIGEVFRITKNNSVGGVNNRSFTYLGDPAVQLVYPKYDVVTTRVNGRDFVTHTDTALALSKLTIEGEVRDYQNQVMSGFNGTVYTTVFAPKQTIKTLANDPDSYEEEFEAYRSILYKGKASVVNGHFTVEFIVPRDLPFNVGKAKISYYAENGDDDANGFAFLYMSPDIDTNISADLEGPKIRLYMNDSFFVRGGVTDQNPYIYALIYDESGINTTGLGIGRDITGTLDNNTHQQIILNDYYDADINDFTRGVVYYRLTDLKEGPHTLKVKVWDVHNNSAEATTDFVVANSIEFAIHNLMAYPNPFSSSTTFSFEHNYRDKALNMEVRIYDLGGKLVKTLTASETHAPTRVTSLVWNAGESGVNRVSPGMYLFKLYVKTEDGQEIEASSRVIYLPNP